MSHILQDADLRLQSPSPPVPKPRPRSASKGMKAVQACGMLRTAGRAAFSAKRGQGQLHASEPPDPATCARNAGTDQLQLRGKAAASIVVPQDAQAPLSSSSPIGGAGADQRDTADVASADHVGECSAPPEAAHGHGESLLLMWHDPDSLACGSADCSIGSNVLDGAAGATPSMAEAGAGTQACFSGGTQLVACPGRSSNGLSTACHSGAAELSHSGQDPEAAAEATNAPAALDNHQNMHAEACASPEPARAMAPAVHSQQAPATRQHARLASQTASAQSAQTCVQRDSSCSTVAEAWHQVGVRAVDTSRHSIEGLGQQEAQGHLAELLVHAVASDCEHGCAEAARSDLSMETSARDCAAAEEDIIATFLQAHATA